MEDVVAVDSWLEVDEAAYAANLRLFRRLLGDGVELAAVVKAEAYGHGRRLIANLAARHGADSFCVHSLAEALDLRAAGLDGDILVMGHVPTERLAEALDADLRLVLYRLDVARRLAELARPERPARVHLKIETGTCRQGIDADEVDAFAAFLEEHPALRLEGVYTHFATAERADDAEPTRRQAARLEASCERLREAGLGGFKRHAACTAAILCRSGTHFEMVRLGIGQYGLWPSDETRQAWIERGGDAGDLRPILTWKARISQVKEIAAGADVGYDRTWRAPRPARLAVLPVGYSDGYDRRLSNRGEVLVGGRRAPVRGLVCMNLLMVDVTDVPDVAAGDEAVLLGRQGDDAITADELAAHVGTINYEIVARLGRELPRRLL